MTTMAVLRRQSAELAYRRSPTGRGNARRNAPYRRQSKPPAASNGPLDEQSEWLLPVSRLIGSVEGHHVRLR